jgi:pimeloyl-ACP methyl ester carboxylesterase
VWRPPIATPPKRFFANDASSEQTPLCNAETAFARARKLDRKNCAACVDYYFYTAASVWPLVQSQIQTTGKPCGRAADLYHTSLGKLISAGQRHGRLNPRNGLEIHTTRGPQFVPIKYHGFVRRPDQFDRLITVGTYRSKHLNTKFRCPGIGVASVAISCQQPDETFRKTSQFFPATAILQPTAFDDSPMPAPFASASFRMESAPFALELFSSLTIANTDIAGQKISLGSDVTAPYAYGLSTVQRNYISEFLRPGSSSENNGLFMTAPFEPDKIPLIFIHGLLSDRITWANMANEIRGRPDLRDRYQIWGFEYATGEPFLTSAARLRRQLEEIQHQYDPQGTNPVFSQVVLVGHSMGGLVSKLQVTRSEDLLWNSVSKTPLENIAAPPETRGVLVDSFFFEPSHAIARVVFMGTPHRGSPWARRNIGRLGALLVEEPSSLESQHTQLIRDNPDTFSREFQRRIPTSIDLLRTDSPLLKATDCLPTSPHVKMHSIIGSYRPMIGAGDSDGVVPVSSARHALAISEKYIRGNHTSLHEKPESVDELVRILREHLHSLPRVGVPGQSGFGAMIPGNRQMMPQDVFVPN